METVTNFAIPSSHYRIKINYSCNKLFGMLTSLTMFTSFIDNLFLLQYFEHLE